MESQSLLADSTVASPRHIVDLAQAERHVCRTVSRAAQLEENPWEARVPRFPQPVLAIHSGLHGHERTRTATRRLDRPRLSARLLLATTMCPLAHLLLGQALAGYHGLALSLGRRLYSTRTSGRGPAFAGHATSMRRRSRNSSDTDDAPTNPCPVLALAMVLLHATQDGRVVCRRPTSDASAAGNGTRTPSRRLPSA